MKTASQVNGTVEKAAQSERPATTPSMLTTMIGSLVKNQQWTMQQTYHPNTLETMMTSKNNVVDYLFSADNLKYTPWQKTFVFLPVKTISKQSVWVSEFTSIKFIEFFLRLKNMILSISSEIFI